MWYINYLNGLEALLFIFKGGYEKRLRTRKDYCLSFSLTKSWINEFVGKFYVPEEAIDLLHSNKP